MKIFNSEHGTNFKAQKRSALNGNSNKQIDVDKAFDKISEFSRNPLKGFSDFTDEILRKGVRAVTTPVKIDVKKSNDKDKDKTDKEEYMKELNRKSEEFIKTNGKVNSSSAKGWKGDLIKSSSEVSKQKEFKQRCDDVADNWEEYQESMEYPVEDNVKPFIHSSKITSANDYGWEVNPDEADMALDMWVGVVGEEQALEDIARAQGDSTLEENLKYIFRNYDLDYEEFESVWDGYDYLMDVIGPEEFLLNLSKAMGTDELSEDLAFIFRMNDFEDWKEYKFGETRDEISNGVIKSEYEAEEDSRTIEHVPQYAVTYMMYGESDGLTDEDVETIDNFMSGKGIGTITGTVEGTENEFDNNPAFGLPTSTVTVTY